MTVIVVLAAAFALTVLVLPAGASETGGAGEIVFERRTGTGVGELFPVRADGTRLRKLGTGRADFDPAWSPDGQRIVLASDRSGGSGAHELYVVNADGTRARRLTSRVLTEIVWTADSAPAWSPDGKRIVFARLEVRGSTSQTDLWLVNADGTGLRRLTRTPAEEAAPAWNGPALAFERERTIYSLPLAADGSPRGTPRVIGRGSDPAFAARAAGFFGFVRDGVVHATDGERVRRIGAGSAPSWSPDGSRLVYTGAAGLVTVRPDGTRRMRLTRPPRLAHDLAPAWRP